MSKYGAISGPYFPVFGLNAEIYGVNLRIQSECRKIRTRNNSVFGPFSRSEVVFLKSHKWLYELYANFGEFSFLVKTFEKFRNLQISKIRNTAYK